MKRLNLILILSLLCYLSTYAQQDDKDYKKYTRCVKADKQAKAEKLFSKGFKIDARAKDGKTAFLYSLQTNKASFAEFFLRKGADIKVTDLSGNTCLHYAIENVTDPQIIYMLVEEGAEVNALNNERYTPFHYSILFACPKLPFYFIEKGADFHTITQFNENALHLALESGCDTIADFLLANQIDYLLIDNKGNSPLLSAMKSNREESAKKLLELDTNINHEDNEGYNSLFYAVTNENAELVKILLKKGISLEQAATRENYLQIAASKENADIVESLLRFGVVNPLICDTHEACFRTAFIYSIESRLVADSLKAGYIENSMNIYIAAKDKYKKELNKIRAKNTAKFIGECCLAASASSTGNYYYGTGFDYELDYTEYLKNQIDKCKMRATSLEKVLNCMTTGGKEALIDCF